MTRVSFLLQNYHFKINPTLLYSTLERLRSDYLIETIVIDHK